MDVNPEITDEEIECDLRTRRNEKSIRVRLGVIEINRVTQANVQSQGVNLADRPDGVEGHLWMDDHILLRKTVLSVIDVVVVLDPYAGTETKPHWPNEKIIRNPLDILTAGFARRF